MKAPLTFADTPQPTVYIVDPDDALQASLRELLRPLRFAVRSFPSAEAFLDGFDGTARGCLIVETDLPGIGGLDLQERLAGRRIDLPVIVLTSQGEVPVAVRALRAGAIEFIEKPFVPHVLVRLVHRAVRNVRYDSATMGEPSDAA